MDATNNVAEATNDVLGSDANITGFISIKKSHYEGATNDGDKESQTREYTRRDFLDAFKKGTTKVEQLAVTC